MLALLVEPDPDFAAVLTYLLTYLGHAVQYQPALVDPPTATAVPLLLIRAELPATPLTALQQLIAQRGPQPTLVLTSAADPAAVAAALGVPAAHCFGLPLVLSHLRVCLATLQPRNGYASTGAAAPH
jgi:hypothetical protein